MSVANRPDVLVVGEALMDITEQDGRVIEHVGGSPANVALGMGRLGWRSALLTQIADDSRGAAISAHMRDSGVSVVPASYSLDRTSTARVRIAPGGHPQYEFDVEWNEVPDPDGLRPRVLHTGSIAAFRGPGAGTVHHILRSTAAEYITFDPNIRPDLIGSHDEALAAFYEIAQLASIVKMSDEDAAWLHPDMSLDEVVDSVLERGPAMVAITRGREGALLATRDFRVHVDAVSVPTVDTIGAGDTFMAALIAAALAGDMDTITEESLSRIGAQAARAASVTVSRAGADLPWAHEL